MISKKTVLILGAGASLDSQFPSGLELIKEVAACMDRNAADMPISMQSSDYDPFSGFSERENFNPSQVRHLLSTDESRFVIQLRGADPPSIDEFLASNKDGFSEIGKIGIVKVISSLEDEKNLLKDENWYRKLWHKVYGGCHTLEDLRKSLENLFIITFNYDRSLEHFLISRAKSMYGSKQENEVITLFKNCLKVCHIYGQVGSLPWQTSIAGTISREYTTTFSGNFKQLSKCILTYTEIMDEKILKESIEKSSGISLKEINRKIIHADNVYFLGFGFHDQNLRFFNTDYAELDTLPWKKEPKEKAPKISGTMFNIGDSRREEIKVALKTKLKIAVNLSDFPQIQISEFFDKKI